MDGVELVLPMRNPEEQKENFGIPPRKGRNKRSFSTSGRPRFHNQKRGSNNDAGTIIRRYLL
jgi:hypothetical protein